MNGKPREKPIGSYSTKKLIALAFVLIITLYLNRTYAYFFEYLGSHVVAPVINNSSNQQYNLASRAVQTNKSIKYFALGDSLTRGVGVTDNMDSFSYKIAYELSKNANVSFTNLAIPGSRSRDLVNRQLPEYNNQNADVVTLLIGTNDILTLISTDEFSRNYIQILNALTVSKNTKLVVINIPYLANSKIMLPPYNFLVDWRTNQFNSIIEALVNQKKQQGMNIEYVDLYSQTKNPFSEDPTLFSIDQFHPTVKGYQLWSDIIIKQVPF